jgi:hypothetical protein
MANTLPSMKGSDSALFHEFTDLFWVYLPKSQGHFPYMGIFSRTAREIWMKIGHELALTYSRVFQAFFRPSKNFHFY